MMDTLRNRLADWLQWAADALRTGGRGEER
jgi:hypothetical protein